MWPPSRSTGRTGRSRFTGSPGARDPREVREKVSSDTSASHQSSPKATTVRQQPFTAMEAPMDTSSSTCEAPMRSRAPSRPTTRPDSSTIPVNMA